jgi:hypothetical protein
MIEKKKHCEKCNVKITPKNWARDLKTKTHLKNDPDQTVKPERPVKHPKPIFTKHRKLHKFFNFSNKLFDNKHNIRTFIKTKETAFKSRLVTYEIENTKNFKDVQQVLDSLERTVKGKIRKDLANRQLKDNSAAFAEYTRDTEEYQEKNFKTHNEIITRASNLDVFYSTDKNKILSEMDEFEIKGSQWTFNRILKMELRFIIHSFTRSFG